jgi:hypothetical protein
MRLRVVAGTVSGLFFLGACGGASESTVANSSESSVVANTNAVSGSDAPSSDPTTPSGSAVTSPLPIGGEPANLLIDSSLDIGAIEGPVVLWFWAPG